MSTYLQKMLRLKLQLNVETDREVAQALELTSSGLNERKRRDRFPTDRVFALERRQPSVDATYVLTGRQRSRSGAPKSLTDGGSQKHTQERPAFTPPTFEEMSAFMDAEMVRMGMVQTQPMRAAA